MTNDNDSIDDLAEAVVTKLGPQIEDMLRLAAARALAGGSARFNRKEAAAILGLSPRTLETWAGTGKGPRETNIGRNCGYTLNDLLEYAAKHQSSVAAE
jgi:Bacterial regulatory protein, Fis family